MNASFFDYDKNGDRDLFLIANPANEKLDDVNNMVTFSASKNHAK